MKKIWTGAYKHIKYLQLKKKIFRIELGQIESLLKAGEITMLNTPLLPPLDIGNESGSIRLMFYCI